MLMEEGAQNTKCQLIFCPPESIAFSHEGEEVWNARVSSDYGLLNEFSLYFETAKKLLASEGKRVVFIDGHLRRDLSQLALEYGHLVLLHDVVPERDYLNDWIFDFPYSANQLCDSLYRISLSNTGRDDQPSSRGARNSNMAPKFPTTS
jgi:hypothetical protein